MRKPRSYLFTKACVISSVVMGLLVLSACGDDTAEPDVGCGENGVMHGDHCDCDAGYSASDDGLSCEADEPTANDEPEGDSQSAESDAANLTFGPSTATGSIGEAQDGSQVLVFEAMDGDVMLRIELFAAFGAPAAPGIVDITSAETDYSTCGTCIMLRTGCVAHHDHYDCTQNFMPRAEGQVDVSAIGSGVGDRFAGELKDIVFQQVSIGQGYVTTPVAGGDVLALDNWSFDVQLDAL